MEEDKKLTQEEEELVDQTAEWIKNIVDAEILKGGKLMEEELFEKFMSEWRELQGRSYPFYTECYFWPVMEKTSITQALEMFNIWLKKTGYLIDKIEDQNY